MCSLFSPCASVVTSLLHSAGTVMLIQQCWKTLQQASRVNNQVCVYQRPQRCRVHVPTNPEVLSSSVTFSNCLAACYHQVAER